MTAYSRRDRYAARAECRLVCRRVVTVGGWRVVVEEVEMQEEGYSGLFYVMLIFGIIGVLGFFVVAAGAAAGGM